MTAPRFRLVAVALLALLTFQVATAETTEEADRLLAEAVEIYRREGPAAALPELERLLQTFRSAGDRRAEAIALGWIGECDRRLGNFAEARDHLDRAVALKRELGERLEEGRTLNVLGLLFWEMGDYDPALEHFRQASAIALEQGDRKLEGATLNNISLVYDELGDYQRSLAQYQRVLEIYRGADYPQLESDTLANLGGVYLLLGRYREALGYYQQALEISQRLEHKPSMSQDLGNLALCNLGLGQIDSALDSFDRARLLASEAGLRQDEAFWLKGKGNALIKKGRYDLGLEHHRGAVEIYEKVGAKSELLETLHDLGELYLLLGDAPSGERNFRQAISLARSIGLAQGITANLLSLGDLERRRERYEEAAALYGQALQRARESEDQGYLIESQLRLALVHRDQRRLDEAAAEAEQALEVSRATGARPLETEALYVLADLDRRRGALQKALAGFAAAKRAAEEVGDPDLLWQIQYGRGQALDQSGQIEEAVAALEEAVTIIEGIRARLREERFRTGYIQDKYQVYVDLVRLQLELGRTGDAFATAERLRARAYLALIDRGEPFALSDEERQAEIELRERIRRLQRALEDEEQQTRPERRQRAVEVFSRELVVAEQEYQAFLDDLRVSRTSQPATPVVPTHTEVRRLLAPGQALLEYMVADEGVTVFVLTSENLVATTSPLRREDLRSKIKLLRDLIQRPGSERWRKPAASLSKALIEPIERAGWLEGVEHLYLVPHGILNYLPFALLPRGEAAPPRLLVEDFVLAYLPAATVLADATSANGAPQSLLAVAPATSRLRYALEEARTIIDLFRPRSRMLAGTGATESSFKSLADRYRVLHLATHGYFNKLNPLLSGLELEPDDSNDGLLEVHEILGLRLDADLVTLSACETGLGSGYFAEVPAGDDFVGLTRAFLQAGSGSVLATLWEVDDRSTVELMESFYRRLRQPGSEVGRATALARAQRELRAQGPWGHPYFWAPFVLVGEMS